MTLGEGRMTGITVSQRCEHEGISVELIACISAQALQRAFEGSAALSTFAGSQAATSVLDPLQLLSAVQPALVEALQGLQESLAKQTLAVLRDEASAVMKPEPNA